MKLKPFDEIYDTACLHKGGEGAVEARLPACLEADELAAIPDASYLNAMSLRIFRAGLKHSMVDAKWPEFEKVFNAFDPAWCAHISDEFIENCMSNKALIRHFGKLKTIRANAYMVMDKATECGSFARFIADWPTDDIVGLWIELKKKGAHLGGGSAGVFLRMVGKDTFMLTNDVIAVLKSQGVVTKEPSSQRDLRAVQAAFNNWAEQSGRPLCEISRIVSMNTA